MKFLVVFAMVFCATVVSALAGEDFSRMTQEQLMDIVLSADNVGYSPVDDRVTMERVERYIDYAVTTKNKDLILKIFLTDNNSAKSYCLEQMAKVLNSHDVAPIILEAIQNNAIWLESRRNGGRLSGGYRAGFGMYRYGFVMMVKKFFPNISITEQMLVNAGDEDADVEGRKAVIKQLEKIVHPNKADVLAQVNAPNLAAPNNSESTSTAPQPAPTAAPAAAESSGLPLWAIALVGVVVVALAGIGYYKFRNKR